MEGTVKFFNEQKGFGFIKGDDDEDYFIHHTFLENGVQIKEGDKVSFQISKSEKGLQAKSVVLV